MAGMMSTLTAWYHTDKLLYALVSMGTMAVVGVFFGLLMDWLGRRMGADTSSARHHREKVSR